MSDTIFTQEQVDKMIAKAITQNTVERDAAWQAQIAESQTAISAATASTTAYQTALQTRHSLDMAALSESDQALVLSLAGEDVVKQSEVLINLQQAGKFQAAAPAVVASVVPGEPPAVPAPPVAPTAPVAPPTAPVVPPIVRPTLDLSGKPKITSMKDASKAVMEQLRAAGR